MNEQQLVLEDFLNHCSRFAGLRIVLYGVGLNTKYIVDHLPCREMIVGLADAQTAGSDKYGYRVYAADELSDVADVVVIVAREALLRMLYERVCHLEAHGVQIYSLAGENLKERFTKRFSTFEDNPYWKCSQAELEQAVSRHSTISFDLFDTLLMRCIVRPHDVFDLVQREYAEFFGREISFTVNRIDAESELNKTDVPSYAQIYERLGEKPGFSAADIAWFAEHEMEWEKKLLVPRVCMVDILKYAIQSGKTVVIVSDMYFSADFLKQLLEECRIPCEGIELIVSNEHGATKKSGKLFDIVKQKYHDILHIGDNPTADIARARAAGIDVYCVMSSAEMLLNSPMYALLSRVRTLDDSLLVGRFMARVLNSPFALCKGKGRVTVDTVATLVEFFAPILLASLRWMLQALGSAQNAVILFMARDGYLMKVLYDAVKCVSALDLPESVYFLASRDALSEKYAAWYEAYNRYWKQLGIDRYDRIFTFDVETKGTSIARFEHVFKGNGGERAELIALNTFNISAMFPHPERVHSYLGDFSFYRLPFAFLKYYELVEILSAPNQKQFLHLDDELRPVYADASSEDVKQWDKIAAAQARILRRLEEELAMDPAWHTRSCAPDLPDTILGMISPEFIQVDDAVKQVFIFESHYEGVGQTNWWERVVG